jgi:hypothetical protein
VCGADVEEAGGGHLRAPSYVLFYSAGERLSYFRIGGVVVPLPLNRQTVNRPEGTPIQVQVYECSSCAVLPAEEIGLNAGELGLICHSV